MNTFAALTPISRRALKIPYESPLLCLAREPASGTGSGGVSVLEILPTLQLPGPALSVELLDGVSVSLSWDDSVPNAYAYIIYRADNEIGPYSVQASGVVERNFVDNPPLELTGILEIPKARASNRLDGEEILRCIRANLHQVFFKAHRNTVGCIFSCGSAAAV